MYKAISAVRENKLSIDCNLFTEEVLRLQSERANALYNLYDMGASFSPSRLDRQELFAYLMEQSKVDCGYLITRDGFIPWTYEMIDYALLKAKDEQFKTVLQSYEIYKYCDEQLNALYKATSGSIRRLSSVTVGSTKIINDISANMSITTDKLSYSNKYLLATALRDCVARNQNTRLIDIDLRGDFLKGLAVAVGVSKDEVAKREYGNESLFVRGISFEDEKYLVWGLASGDIVSDGEFSKQLESELAKQRSTRNEDGAVSDSYITVRSRAFIEGIEFTLSTLREFEKRYERFKYRYIWVDENYITAEVACGFIDTEDELIAFRPQRRVGYFVKDYESDVSLPDVNLMKGISGEYITESACERNGYHIEGLPVLMITGTQTGQSHGKVVVNYHIEKYYSILDVRCGDGTDEYSLKPLEPRVGSMEEIVPRSLEKTYANLGVTSFEEFKNVLYTTDTLKMFYRDATGLEETSYKNLVVSILINYILSQVVVYDVTFQTISGYSDTVLVNATADALVAYNALWRG